MATTLAELALRITATDTASPTFTSMGTKIKQELGDITKLAAGLALGNLGSNIGMNIAERLKSAAEQIDTFGTAVRGVQVVAGGTAEDASAWVAIMEHFGLTGDEAASKISRFERALTGTDTALDLTATGGKRGQQILDELGVTYRDGSGHVLSYSEALKNLAARWPELDAASKNNAVRGLVGGLGGGGAEKMNLILDQGRDGLDKLIATFQKEHLILSQESVDDVTKFTFAHTAMDDAFKGLAVSLGTAFMPAITSTAAVVAYLTQKVVQDLVPAIKGMPDFVGPATLAVVGLGIGMQILDFVIGPILAPFRALIGLIIGHGAASATSAAATATAAAAEATAGAAAAVAAVPTQALAVAQAEVGTSALVATGLLDQYGNMIMRDGAMAAAAAGENATLAASEAAAGAAGTTAAGGVGVLGTALATVAGIGVGAIAIIGGLVLATAELVDVLVNKLENLGVPPVIAELAKKLVPFGGSDALEALKDFAATFGDLAGKLMPQVELPASVKDDIAKFQAEIDASIKANTPTIDTSGADTSNGPSETALEAQAKAKKSAADANLKQIQDEAKLRKDDFDKGELANQTTAMRLKLGADEATNNAQLLDYKRQIEDLDSHSIDYALKRQQLDESDAATVAKMAEAKLQAQADDLSYQEKLLLSQARATRAAGGSVDMGALRSQILAIREQQIQGEPGLLMAQHNATVADRASQLTNAQQSMETNTTERQKLAIQQAMQPFTDAAMAAKRAADFTQQQLDLDKVRFEIEEQAHKTELLDAEATAKKWDEAYQSALNAAKAASGGANAQGGVGTAPYGPLPNGVAGGAAGANNANVVNITNNNTVRSDADVQAIVDKTTDQVYSGLNAATAQQSNTKPAYYGLPGAFAASTP